MKLVMLKNFAELSETEMKAIDGGHTDWGKVGYELVTDWCNFWGGIGEKVYDFLH